MASRVMVPGKSGGTQSTLTNAGTIVGGVVGGIYGGPGGAVEGAGEGGAIGSKVGGALGGNTQAPQAIQSDVKDTAMTRRMDSIDSNPSQDLAQADAALQQLPQQYQDQYGPMIRRARMIDQNGGTA